MCTSGLPRQRSVVKPVDIWILKPMRGVGELLYYTHTDMIHAGESSPPELDLFQLLLCALRKEVALLPPP